MVFGAKCSAKSKLFEQPLDKLFSPKAIKQLNNAIGNANNTKLPLANSASVPLAGSPASSWAKLSQDNSATKRKRAAARLRRFTIDANNNAHVLSNITTNLALVGRRIDNHNNIYNLNTGQHQASQLSENERRQLLLSVLPEPIRRLLNELYLRGPATVGIFRKSPNAKHCKELRHKLESDGQSSIEQFQVNVIASVFKECELVACVRVVAEIEPNDMELAKIEQQEWLRSLPDCLLMSRLYPQWIDVAKLIEPLHLHQQQQQQARSQHHQTGSSSSPNGDHDGSPGSSGDSTIISGSTTQTTTSAGLSLRPSPTSPLTDNGHHSAIHHHHHQHHHHHRHHHHQRPVPLVRARSCSIMTSDAVDHSSSNNIHQDDQDDSGKLTATSRQQQVHNNTGKFTPLGKDSGYETMNKSSNDQTIMKMSEFALKERHSECIRIVRQLLETLNEANLILLRAIICVLWHIANNSEHNKMSSTNLGVCVGQSLLNDEHQSKSHQQQSGSSSSTLRFSASTFTKRHRRARSQCLLSSTLSLTSLTSPLVQLSNQTGGGVSHLESNSAQEAARYVPMLVAFMIDNARALFGPDIVTLFGPQSEHVNDSKCDNKMELLAQSTTDSIDRSLASSADNDNKENNEQTMSIDLVDHVDSDDDDDKLDDDHRTRTIFKRQQNVGRISRQQPMKSSGEFYKTHRRHLSTSVLLHIGSQQQQQPQQLCDYEIVVDDIHRPQQHPDEAIERSGKTSILIVNAPKKNPLNDTSDLGHLGRHGQDYDGTKEQLQSPAESCGSGSDSAQQRPLSATESTTSSSRASSSTSGVHSESPAFSNEPDSHRCANSTSSSRTATTCSSSSSASISSPAPSSSAASGCTSPVDVDTTHQRSHVMLLRDYFLSLQQQNQKQQQQLNLYRLQRQSQSQQQLLSQQQALQQKATLASHHQHSHQHHHLQQHHQHQHQTSQQPNGIRQQSVGRPALRQHSTSLAGNLHQVADGLVQHQQPAAIAFQRGQLRLARIRPNQFNGLYVRRADSAQQVGGAPAGSGGSNALLVHHHLVEGELANRPAAGESQQAAAWRQGSKVSLSAEHTADEESDDCTSEGWMESTMV